MALDLARTRGLGLVGSGALDAVRALLLELVAGGASRGAVRTQVLLTTAEARRLFEVDEQDTIAVPSGLRTVETLDDALDQLESEVLARTRRRTEEEQTLPFDELVLITSPASYAARRIQAVLDNGSTLGITGVLIGQWAPGATLRVRTDGTLGATSPDLARVAGARLFHVPAPDARDILSLLTDAEGTDAESGLQEEPVPEEFEIDAEASPPLGPQATDVPQPPTVLSASPHHVLGLQVLGRVRLVHHCGDQEVDISGAISPKQREILLFLALHPDGVRREAIAAAIWPTAPRSRPYNSFHATLSQLRRVFRSAADIALGEVVVHQAGHYAFAPELVAVDLWEIQRLLSNVRGVAGDQPRQEEEARRVVNLYTGDLAEDMACEWIEADREGLRREVLDAYSVLIRAAYGQDIGQALSLLERARVLDPFNEAIYRDIARTQARLEHYDAIPRTLKLLETTLAQLDERPSRQTVDLFASLQRAR
ncbi:hypothetical protein [Streptomyces sp. NPDC059009]|uniref:AfsR/SARP family transcriptional regulator n=1 Tax=Streptomyces sp. NPDC059009 TaxID=3346694 RepID=UPI00368AA18F